MSPFYKQLLDNLYDGVYFVDRDRAITYWNKGTERLTGYTADGLRRDASACELMLYQILLHQPGEATEFGT